MSIEIVQQKLLNYHCQTVFEQENALKEIAQEIALMALSQTGFFQVAAFQGGTCLRILYGLERFSEDLDFILENPDKNFSWTQYAHTMQEAFITYGFNIEFKDRTKIDNAVKMAFLKAESEGGLLIVKDLRTNKPQLKIKLEIDSNPPQHSIFELKYLDFPLPFSIKAQDLSSLFAGKCHALLCRGYTKGRDWYDFIWYVSRQTPINFELLNSAIFQVGPWENQNISITSTWLIDELKSLIHKTNWDEAKKDVERFLHPQQMPSLTLWSNEFFMSRIEKLAGYLSS